MSRRNGPLTGEFAASTCWLQGTVGSLVILSFAFFVPDQALPMTLAGLVAVVGMPHGGLDHRTGRALLRPLVRRHWWWLFYCGYATVMMIVVAVWFFVPFIALTAFVLLSAYHFGTADETIHSPLDSVLILLVGGMVVWVPALFQPDAFTLLLSWVVPYGFWPEGLLFDRAVRWSLIFSLVVVAGWSLTTSITSRIRIVGFGTLFAVAPPLVSFAVYFCGWHSVIELTRLSRQANPENPPIGFRDVVLVAAPLSILATLLGSAGWFAFADDGPSEPGVIQAVFIGLSVVAVPHMLLHLVVERKRINPFAGEAA